MPYIANTVEFIAGSSGTADFSDGTATTGMKNLAGGSLTNGAVYSYRAEHVTDKSIWEEGYGAVNTGTPALARTTIEASTTGSKINFASAPVVFLVERKRDFDLVPHYDRAQSPTAAQQDQVRANAGIAGVNFLFNPSGEINQAGVGSQADGSYDFDQWVVLTQSNPVTSSQLTDVEDGTPFMMRLSQANASAQRFGRIQWLERLFCSELRGQAATLSARVRMSASTTLRYAVVSWTGAANVITKDVVADWTNGTFTAGNFFNNTTLTIEGAGSIALTANTLTDITPLTIAVLSSSMNNLAVFFWTDSTQAQNVTLDIAKAKLEKGTKATPFSAPDPGEELLAVKRWWEKLFVFTLAINATNYVGGSWTWNAEKMNNPTMTWDDNLGNASKFQTANTPTGNVAASAGGVGGTKITLFVDAQLSGSVGNWVSFTAIGVSRL